MKKQVHKSGSKWLIVDIISLLSLFRYHYIWESLTINKGEEEIAEEDLEDRVVEVAMEVNLKEEEDFKRDHQEPEVVQKYSYNSIVCQAFMWLEVLRSV